MIYLRKILITTDLSEYSLAAVEYAASFGLLYSSKLYLLHVTDPAAPLFAVPGMEANGSAREQRVIEQGTEELKAFVERHISRDVKIIPVVVAGVPAEEIKRFAEEVGIDLIVLATHGRTGLRHIVMGSVAEKVVRLSGIPVLTVKPHPFRETIIEKDDIESELHLR